MNAPLDHPLPHSVRYVKNGTGGQWWKAAKANRQIHLGWSNIPPELLRSPDFSAIEQITRKHFADQGAATRDFKALRCLLDTPSQHIWITFEDDCMWWCTVRDGAEINPLGRDQSTGNFWLVCDRPWSDHSLKGKQLAMTDLPGTVTATAGFRGTVSEPQAWEAILRVIRDETDPNVDQSAAARGHYVQAMVTIVNRLRPKDFEQLIDLILTRTGWARISTLGGAREGIDVEVQNLTADEIAFVQVKGRADQSTLDDYVARFNERSRYARMIFAVHTPIGQLTQPADPHVQIWTSEKVAQLVVRLGLGEWVENKV